MSSFLRNLQRRVKRNAPDHEPPEQYIEAISGGYRTLHPTKGWRRVSAKRYHADRALGHLLGA